MSVSTLPSTSSSSSHTTTFLQVASTKEQEKDVEGQPSPLPLLLLLPPELIDHLLSLVPPSHRQITSLALTRVFPQYPISERHLFEHVVVYNARQLWPLWRKLKSINDHAQSHSQVDPLSSHEDLGVGVDTKGRSITRSGAIKSFTLKSWKGDVDILNNILRCISPDKGLNTIMLNIGTNFSPDHLEEMFENPRMEMRRLEMRFRPYVEQASYYQFLAGSYFDTAVETLTKKWPSLPSFTHLSIVQDLPPRSTVPPTAVNSKSTSLAGSFADLSMAGTTPTATESSSDQDDSGRSTPPTSISSASENPFDIGTSKAYTGHGPFGNPFLNEKLGITKPKTFAQPIVFFDINCISKFGLSPVAEHLTHLRLRVPSRDILRVLIAPPRGMVTTKRLFPSLRYLDISTTNVRIDTNLTTLLRTYSRLEHLVLDRVNLFGFTARDKGPELCNDLGGLIVSAGLARGKEKERQIAQWELEQRTRLAEVEAARVRAQRLAAEQERAASGTSADSLSQEVLAEISRRERMEEQQRQIELARSRRGHRSAAQSTFTLRDRSRRAGPSTTAGNIAGTSILPMDIPPPDKLYMVLPPLPTLKSISIGGEASGVGSARVIEWEEEFHRGWKEALGKVLGWATHIADKYERARKKAEEWRAQEMKESNKTFATSNNNGAGAGVGGKHGNGHVSKSKRRASISSSSSKLHSKPPTDIRLFRFPFPGETVDEDGIPGLDNLTTGLIEIDPSDHREYLDIYKQAIADAQLYLDYQYQDNLALDQRDSGVGGYKVSPPCVLCTVPDCEGPARRGAEGERVDGRGGMSGRHKEGCGHLLGRRIWSWEGFDHE
ncbi:hypothetical protein I302_102256 [Kwoniella bestiolae CBS 10118]|uniref:F-box domain-containing protein n=1 Tax=Kwoniella bestiolae CBS 10118 TaxID=1296100 RepID=A0A1B9GEJ3_9TREE|nr:hypothetical protein I302_00945 [Kwoniella bestiolae CBS 10118]OCF29440.1 hypothetical protein I302_00945 [Kwoniella bestiolae CBS 10118]